MIVVQPLHAVLVTVPELTSLPIVIAAPAEEGPSRPTSPIAVAKTSPLALALFRITPI